MELEKITKLIYLTFFSFSKISNIMNDDTLEQFCSASIFSNTAEILSLNFFFATIFHCKFSTINF